MSFRLVPLMKGNVPVIPLTRPALLIGRHAECDIQLMNAPVSRFHCCVALAYDRILIRDLGSRNGVRVNGMLVEEARLFSGDEVAIGPVIYRLTPEDASEQDNAPSRQSSPTPASGGPPPRGTLAQPSSSADDDDLPELVSLDD